MRLAGETLTPATRQESRDRLRYQQRLKASVLWPIYDDTVVKLASLPFQKPPTISGELPDELEPMVGNADRMGTTLASFARKIYEDGIDRGMGLFLVDNVSTIKADGQTITLEEAEGIDARPYFRRIHPDNYLGCKVERLSGIDRIVEFRFKEQVWKEENGTENLVDRVEIWNTETVRVFDTSTGKSETVMVSEVPNTLGFVPLVVFYTNKVGATLEATSPLEDLAWQNVAHWNSNSMQTEALRYCRFPILQESGADPLQKNQAAPEMGPGASVRSTNPEHRVGFISPPSLEAGDIDIANIERRCHSLGMQPLVGVGGPSTATGEVRADMSEKSEAQTWIEALEWAVWRGFVIAAAWVGATLPDDLDWTLFRDSSLISGRATDVPMIFSAFDKKLISRETTLRELVLRGTIATVEDPEEEIAAVDQESEAAQQAQMEILARSIKEEDAKSQQQPGEAPREGDPGPGVRRETPIREKASA